MKELTFISALFREIMFLSLLVLMGADLPAQKENKLFAPGAELILLDSSSTFTEGPASDPAGNVYYTDQPNDRILKWSVADGKVSEYMENTGRSNGLYFDHQGQLIACADLKNQLWKIAPDRTYEILVSNFEGKKLNGPNDLWIDSKGGIYFTDPFYKRDYWSHSEPEIETQDVYYLAPGGTELKRVATNFVRPNGIIGTPNGKYLYVVDIQDKKTYRYRINKKDGSLSDRKLFVEMGSDGMTLDHKGNLYLTGQGVTIFNKKGEQIGKIDIPQRWTANITFGGANQNKLFITAMSSLYSLDMKVRGVRW